MTPDEDQVHSPPQVGILRRIAVMAALVFAGEAIFGLPFVIARVFRPTVLDVFQISNLELGAAFSLYGVVAMASYFFGGPLADRFSARRLMSVALLATGLGGIYYATLPTLTGLKWLFAYWGLTTILLFWSALIRATREWGDEQGMMIGRGANASGQGKAFGILDGGRGLFAAVLATVTVAVFAAFLPVDAATATLEQRSAALTQVIWVFTSMCGLGAALVWICVPEGDASHPSVMGRHLSLPMVRNVLVNPAVWLQGVIVVCAYTGYKGTDDFGLYARDAFGFDDVESASVGTLCFWIRPLAAIGIGLLADRFRASQAVLCCFVALFVGDTIIALGFLSPSAPWMLYTAVVGTSAMVFGLRGVYFALFEEAQVPPALTGTAAGVVSVVGYTPDVFMGPLMGYLTVTYPGALGHQYLFGSLAAFALVGGLATIAFQFFAVEPGS